MRWDNHAMPSFFDPPDEPEYRRTRYYVWEIKRQAIIKQKLTKQEAENLAATNPDWRVGEANQG